MRFERKLYVIRKRVEHAVDKLPLARAPEGFYIPSLSSRTLIYKGMLTADQIRPMFPDLADPDFESALALVHQRFSTNTFPSWPLAHPYRFVAHNGEINTLRGNINWMRAREGLLKSDVLRRRSAEDPADHPRGRQRYGDVRQRARVPGDDRAVAAARHPDDDSRAVGGAREHGPRAQGVLRVPLVADGAVGRPGVDRVHRRHGHRRRARPQRPAAVALLRHQGRPGHHGVGGRRARHSGRGHRASRSGCTRAASSSSTRRTAASSPTTRSSASWRRRSPYARVAGRESRRHRRSADGALSAAAQPRDGDRAPADVRLHARRPAAAARADGDQRRGSARLDGHRHLAGGAVGSAAAALRLLQAGVRAGHQSAARRDPRGAGHLDGIDDRAGGQPARSAARVVPADQDQVPGHRQRPAGEAAPRLRARVPGDDAADAVRSAAGRRRPRAARWTS